MTWGLKRARTPKYKRRVARPPQRQMLRRTLWPGWYPGGPRGMNAIRTIYRGRTRKVYKRKGYSTRPRSTRTFTPASVANRIMQKKKRR